MNSTGKQNKYTRYYAAIRYLESLGNIAGGYQKTNLAAHPHPEMFIKRMHNLLDLLGNPENGFKYVHITGTAGKGSVASAVHARLVRSRKVAGLFTSPFTVSTIEKIQVGNKYIDPLMLTDITDEIKPKVDAMIETGKHGPPSYFEMMLAIALIYFKKTKCEYVVLEVGLGGRYDATNIIKSPLITAITNISLDHTNILGHERSDIARDKSGIIKKNSKFFTTEEDPNLLKLFKDVCSRVGAQYIPINVKGLDYLTRNSLLASHICASLGVINSPIETVDIPSLPARFEIVSENPIIIIDGAHNPSKIESTIYNLKRIKYNKLILVISISADKDWKRMARMIAPYADQIYVTRFTMSGRQSADPKLLCHEMRKYARFSSKIFLYSDPVQAYNDAKDGLSKRDALLVTGSFYLAGDIRSIHCPESRILRKRNSRISKIPRRQ